MEILIAILMALGIPGFNGLSNAQQKAKVDHVMQHGIFAPDGGGQDDDGAGKIYVCPICLGGAKKGVGDKYLHASGKIETLAAAHGN